MAVIRGKSIMLLVQDFDDVDSFNHLNPYTGEWVQVDDVLYAPVSDEEATDSTNLTGRKATYQLAIPKGDTHTWQAGGYVFFNDEYWRIIGHPTEGIDENIPLRWNKKVKVESMNGSEMQA